MGEKKGMRGKRKEREEKTDNIHNPRAGVDPHPIVHLCEKKKKERESHGGKYGPYSFIFAKEKKEERRKRGRKKKKR